MTYEELKAKELKLTEELKNVRAEIIMSEQTQAHNLLGLAIKHLEDVDNMMLGTDCYFEVWCEECEESYDTNVSLADVIQSLKVLREEKVRGRR